MILFKHSRSGKFYKFITMAKHTETDESLVIYEDFTKTDDDIIRVWARPEKNFFEYIIMEDGTQKRRFEKVEDYTTIFTKEEVQELLDIVSNKIKCVDSVKCRNADIFQKWFSA